MALATRTARPSPLRTLWGSTVGKKAVMATTGLVMLLYLVAHMFGNLKVFSGPGDFNGYAAWLRTAGTPVLPHGGLLWLVRVVLAASVVLHGVAAWQLSRRDRAARPRGYVHRRRSAGYATHTMRWGGVVLGLFIVWHLMDLTTLTVNPRAQEGHPYENLVASLSTWYGAGLYSVAMLALCLHVHHGLWSAAQTLGVNSARRDRALKAAATTLSAVLTIGFLSVPVAVTAGVVS